MTFNRNLYTMILDRGYRPVSATSHLGNTRIELRIHGDNPDGKGDGLTLLSKQEARIVGHRLIAEAELLADEPNQP